jgi:hypothetical protein
MCGDPHPHRIEGAAGACVMHQVRAHAETAALVAGVHALGGRAWCPRRLTTGSAVHRAQFDGLCRPGASHARWLAALSISSWPPARNLEPSRYLDGFQRLRAAV